MFRCNTCGCVLRKLWRGIPSWHQARAAASQTARAFVSVPDLCTYAHTARRGLRRVSTEFHREINAPERFRLAGVRRRRRRVRSKGLEDVRTGGIGLRPSSVCIIKERVPPWTVGETKFDE